MFPYYVFRITPVRTSRVSGKQIPFGQIQDDGNAVHVLLPGQIDDLFPCRLLHVSGIDDSSAHQVETLVRSVKEQIKRFKEKRFAAGANREQINSATENFPLSLEDFITIVLEGMKESSVELGLGKL